MSISIDWFTRVIFVPKDYLTPTSSPTIFNMDTNDFRLQLKDLESSVDGISYPDTNQHNTEVPLGGIIYARVIEIINDYTITFENGFYAVNLYGSNNNIGDVVNLNFVSVRTNNSAGLIVDPSVSQSLDYGEHIIYSEEIGTTGTEWPVGTYANPVNNPSDLQALLTLYGRAEVMCLSDITLTQEFNDISFVSKTGDEHFYPNGFRAHDCSFTKMIISGDFNHSKIFANQCSFYDDVTNIGGTIFGSMFFGDIKQTPIYQLVLSKCSSTKLGTEPVVIDMVLGVDTIFGTRGHSGPIEVINCDTTNSTATIIFESGSVNLTPTCSDGLIVLGGISSVLDNSNVNCEIDITGVINPDTSNNLAYGGKVFLKTNSNNSGRTFPYGTEGVPLNNLDDAIYIAESRGIKTLSIDEDWVFSGDTFINDYRIEGNGMQHSTFTFLDGAILLNCTFQDAKCTGDITGIIGFDNCHLIDIGSTNPTPSNQDIIVYECLVDGTISLTSAYSGSVKILECKSGVPGLSTPIFNLNNANSNFFIRDYTGGIKIMNSNQPVEVSIDMLSGNVILDETITNGTWVVRGISDFTNNATGNATVINAALLDPSELDCSGSIGNSDTDAIAAAVWNKLMSDHQTDDSFGKTIQSLLEKANEAQHSMNVQTEMLKNKPNNC